MKKKHTWVILSKVSAEKFCQGEKQRTFGEASSSFCCLADLSARVKAETMFDLFLDVLLFKYRAIISSTRTITTKTMQVNIQLSSFVVYDIRGVKSDNEPNIEVSVSRTVITIVVLAENVNGI